MATYSTPTNLVFKVKFGDALKRINGSLNNEQSSLNIPQLKSKIRECFAITRDEEFVLSYVDIDGDTVMLADESDLYDVTFKQGLNPVRVTVELVPHKTKKSGHKHGVQQTKINTGKRAEASSPASYLVGAADAMLNGSKQAQIKPEPSHRQPTVDNGVKYYDYYDQKYMRDPWGTDEVPTETYLKTASKSAWNSYKKLYSPVEAPISSVDANYSAEFVNRSQPKVSHNRHVPFSMTSRDDYDKLQMKLALSLRGKVVDVTFPSGSKLAPGTSFTKIWKVWNVGNVTWPYGTQIQNVVASSGFAVVVCADLEIPTKGLELNGCAYISMDLKAGSSPGKYFAVWDLVPPPGFSFAYKQQISVSIIVSGKLNSEDNSGIDEVRPQDLDNSVKIDSTHCTIVEPTKRVRIPEVGFKRGSSKGKAVVEGVDNFEESMLIEELNEMGFYDEELNMKVLRSSNYDLDVAIDCLCGMTEDYMLDDDDMMY